ncbi:MAG TPA: LysR family transcriptional regulator [Stellaceae bacterium]|nr:LysR family transcriptional regulator [Stellaceae bacterium]
MDIRAVDLNLLKAFAALDSERAVTRAAARIGLSQPAMSHALARLRELFADDLFVRGQSGMAPTARAREIAPLVAAAIERIETALNLGARFDPAASAATFTAGMGEYAEVALVGRLADAFGRAAPQARLRLVALHGADAAEQLEQGRIDAAVAHLRTLPPAVESAVLFRDPFVVVARGGHPIAQAPLTVEAYAAQRHVLVSPRGEPSGALDRVLVDYGERRHVALVVATYLAVPAALAASNLIATLPSRTAALIAGPAGLVVLPLPVDFALTVRMAWHRRAAGDAAQSWFRGLITEAARADGAP